MNCSEALLTIQAHLLPATRRVRLLLSNGRTITTAAIRLPRSDGGPAGIYYQVVRGPSPIPVSLTELGGAARRLRTDGLPAIRGCTKPAVKFLPGGLKTLVSSRVPGGPMFTIKAQRYRFLDRVYLQLSASASSESSSSVAFGFHGGSTAGTFRSPHARAIFEPEQQTGCGPDPYVVVFGILHDPRDRVLVRTAGGLVALHTQALPPSLHAQGVLAWGAFSPPPTEILATGTSGSTLLRESLAEAAKSLTEQCEGEAEGPLPPQ